MTSFTLNQPAHPPSTPEPGAAPLGASLGGIGGAEMELKKLLINENMKCETYKTNYRTLKTEYTRLEDAYSQSQGELKRLLQDSEAEQENVKQYLSELHRQLQEKNTKLDELQRQIMTPQRLELLRVQVQQEVEASTRERFSVLEEEAQKYRCECNKLKYGIISLTAQLDHQRDEHARILEDKTNLHEAEISRLVKEKKDVVACYQHIDPLREAKRVETLQQEKFKLCVQLKSLEAEVAELHAQKENLAQQAENVQRIQTRQHAESQTALKSAEVENQSLRQQLERMERDLRESYEENRQLNERFHKAERDVSSLTTQMEILKCSHKEEVSSMKLECTHSKREMEMEKDALQGQIDGLQEDLEKMQEVVEQHKEVLFDKEREVVRKIQTIREEESRKFTALHEEKLELANRLASLERTNALQDAAERTEKMAWEERLHRAQLGEESAHRELQSLRTKLQEFDGIQKQRETELSDLQQQNLELRVQLERHTQSESDFRETLSRVREELRMVRAEEEQLEERHAKLQQKYSVLKNKLKRAAEAQKKRKSQTENKEKKLQDKAELLEAKNEELKLEVALVRKQTSFSEDNAKLRRQLKEQQRRLFVFERLLFGGQGPGGAGPDFMTSSQVPFPLLGSEGPPSTTTEEQHHKQLSLLRQRLKDLERTQQVQLEELGSVMQRERDPRHVPDL
ncbi:centrosomal protein of 83 kDa [Antennarius striatus]|uniref:centrosomal protein of 83 kDa n=1 Tax=Antennarius striatus TaxID=241820 RepID=UPI0035AEE997